MSRLQIGPVNAVTPQGITNNAIITIENGIITSITPTQTSSAQPLLTAVPAFIDLHIHGAGGFGPEQKTPKSLLQLSQVLARQGVSAFCPTLYGAAPDQMAALLRALVPALGKETGARILGFHVEGPFLSPEQPGVMRLQDMAPANLDDFKKMHKAAQGHIAIITLAPELPGIESVIRFCLAHNILVQAGHTNATYEQIQHAANLGVRRVTHLGNAMSGLHHRAPGVLGAALENPQISCEVIADGKHVHPALLRLLKQLKPISHITAVTDALLPTGQTIGPFYANGDAVTLQDGVWKRNADGVTAGSALTMAGAFAQLYRAGYTLPQAAACTSTNAARLLGLNAQLAPNAPANLVLLDEQFTVRQVILNGTLLH